MAIIARKHITAALILLLPALCAPLALRAGGADSLKKATIISARSTRPERVSIEIRSVDISRFPVADVIIDARDSVGNYFSGLKKTDLVLYQDGLPVSIQDINSISASNNVPVDIVFVVDQTGSMRQEVNEVKNNIFEFTQRLSQRGVDYRLGLITFSDRIERRKELTEDVNVFITYIDNIAIGGGGDSPENALEGLAEATTLRFRQSAQRIFILITDAPFHQKGDAGDGKTEYTTKSIVEYLKKKNVRLFSISPPRLTDYRQMTDATFGKQFDIVQDFSSILDEFSASITNLYAVRYTIKAEVPPEAITLEIRNMQDEVVVNQRVPILEVDKKFVLENILFEFNQASFDQTFVSELRNILNMLKTYPTIHVEIRGHTDFLGSDEYNIALSDARARAVKKYLVDRGINAVRITTRGMGKSLPIAPNDSEIGRRLNRRTEVIITKK